MCTDHAWDSTPKNSQESIFCKVNTDCPFIAYYLHILYEYVTHYRAAIRVLISMDLVIYKLELSYTTYIRNFRSVGLSCLFSGALTLVVSRYGYISKTGSPSLNCGTACISIEEMCVIKIYHRFEKQPFSIRAALPRGLLN